MFWCPEMFWGLCGFGVIGVVGKACLMVREGARRCVRGALQICCSRNLPVQETNRSRRASAAELPMGRPSRIWNDEMNWQPRLSFVDNDQQQPRTCRR